MSKYVPLPKIKRGDTFYYFAQYDETVLLSELRSQVKTKAGALIDTPVITATATPGLFKFTVMDTSTWPLGMLLTDIRRENVTSGTETSETMSITIESEVTE